MLLDTTKDKAVKELELMAKKIKKRISLLESFDIVPEYTESIVILSKEYREIKETIIRIITN